MSVTKKVRNIIIYIGSSIGLGLLLFLCGRNSNRRGVQPDPELVREGAAVREGIDRSLDEISGEREALRENHRVIGTANKSVQSELEYAIGILKLAKERSVHP